MSKRNIGSVMKDSNKAAKKRMKISKRRGERVLIWVMNGSKGQYEADLNVDGRHEDINATV